MRKLFIGASLLGILMMTHRAFAFPLASFEGKVTSNDSNVVCVQDTRPDPPVTMYFTLDWRTKVRKAGKFVEIKDILPDQSVRVRYYSNADVPRVEILATPKPKPTN